MGNTVSAADLAAAQIIHPNEPIKFPYHPETEVFRGKEIPEECPMHKKSKPVSSECPVNHGQEEVNPLNLVSERL